jgi:hypothetical protein
VAVELAAVLVRLAVFAAGRRRRFGLQPRLQRRVLGVEVRQVRHQVLDDLLVRQREDADVRAAAVGRRLGAGERVDTVDVHGARAAHTLAAGAAQREAAVLAILDVQQGVQHHRAAVAGVHLILLGTRRLVGLGIVAVDLEHHLAGGRGGARLRRQLLAFDAGFFRHLVGPRRVGSAGYASAFCFGAGCPNVDRARERLIEGARRGPVPRRGELKNAMDGIFQCSISKPASWAGWG